jgi:crotonobetainyl-CoA:carnitine CoA-transferase CaiB-like acyl-CoA transferase
VYQAKDRGFSLAAGSDKLWSALCDVMGQPGLAAHPDFSTNPQRVKNRARLEPMLDEIFAQRPAADWLESLRRAGVPCALVRDFAEVAADAQAAVREMFPSVDHPAAGPQRVTGPPVKLSETPGRVTTAAPALGQDTRRVLADLLGLSAMEIDRLVKAGAVIAP